MAEISKQTEAVIWDLDGTLLDSHGIYCDLVNDIAPAFGLAPPEYEVLQANFHGTLDESIFYAFEGRLKKEQLVDFVEHFLDKQGVKYDDIEHHILRDALDLSKKLTVKGIRQAIVTNRDHMDRGNASPRSIVERSSLKDHIQHIICGDEAATRKPDSKVLGTLLNDWGVEPDNIVVIGDQHVDAQLALNLGAKGIIVTRNGAEFADHHLDDKNWQSHISIVESLSDVVVVE